jgi:hypothetical protein
VAIQFVSQAQIKRLGFTAGIAIANYKLKVNGNTGQDDAKPGFTVGILTDFPISKNFSFQPAANFVQKGTKGNQYIGNSYVEAKLNVNCIEVPLNLLFKINGKPGIFFLGTGLH